jgi:prepilin-type N-terminal cleavage/methylation domain-containing protein
MMVSSRSMRGFSLLELLIALFVMALVGGIVLRGVSTALQRYQTEEYRTDITQESREFLDQVIRDLHTIGYPNVHMYAPGVLGATQAAINSNASYAVGLVAVSATDLWFEGDLDGSGQVQSVRYQLQSANGSCPCTMRRGTAIKVGGTAPDAQTPAFNVELQNVLNSTGGAAPYPIAGSVSMGGTVVNYDTLYATYKTAPVFSFFDNSGNAVIVPNDLTGGNLATGETAAASVKGMNVVINVFGVYEDPKTQIRPTSSMRGTVKINNF